MRFIWDEAKRKSNLAKHGYDFADAHKVFSGSLVLAEDGREDYGEQRMLALGQLDTVVVMIVHVEFDDSIRVISMRKATKHEANDYYEKIGNT
jgi:uncharacterized protein